MLQIVSYSIFLNLYFLPQTASIPFGVFQHRCHTALSTNTLFEFSFQHQVVHTPTDEENPLAGPYVEIEKEIEIV